MDHFDVVIVGAGLSGIGAAYHLQANCPGKTYAILEGREAIGGTWDLFRYPGIRSDSTCTAMRSSRGSRPRPSPMGPRSAMCTRYGQGQRHERHIRFRHQVKRADWSSADARWTVEPKPARTNR